MLPAPLARAVADALGEEVSEAGRVSGGDINDAYRLRTRGGRLLFLKTHPDAAPSMFPAEAAGLRWLAEAGGLRVPEVVAVSREDAGDPPFLLLEWLEPGRRLPDFDVRLGRGLAELHRFGAAGFGLDHDGFIGTLPQGNRPTRDWPTFYAERRLLPQLERARRRGLVDGRLGRRLEALAAALPALVGPAEPPARLHGDLWGGNLHVDPEGAPCLIDPAPYGGHREIDLAMMRLFGGFGRGVFDAYGEAHPLAAGHEERVPLYQLYPLLVHVNLFGGGYVRSVEGAIAAMGY